MPLQLPLPTHCPNCDAAVHGPYCSQCGQETQIGVLKLRDFSHEYFQNFVTLESRLWRTLWTLIRHPGMLTTEFLAGRRRRYVRPLPLYLSLSFALFLLLTVMQVQLLQMDSPASAPFQFPLNDVAANGRPQTIPDLTTVETELGLPDWSRPIVKPYYEVMKRWNADPMTQLQRLLPIFQSRVPYAVFLLVPLFALNTRALYFRRKRPYAEHFLFALHLHALVFLTLIVKLATNIEALTPLLFLGWWVYLAIALKRLLAGRWWPQFLRAGYLLASHAIALALVLLITLVLTLPTV